MTTPTPAAIELPALPDAIFFGEGPGCVAYNAAEMRDYAQAAILADRARTAASCAGWMPIGSAPKDATEILLSNGVVVAEGHWLHAEGGITEHRDTDGRYIGQDEHDGFDGWIDWSGGMLPEPTLWMPLPAAPGAPATARAERTGAARCSTCDGAGDVHSFDGEWRGECTACVAALVNELDSAAGRLTQRTSNPLDGLLNAAARKLEELDALTRPVAVVQPVATAVTLTALNLRNALDFVAPDFDAEEDQRETEVTIGWAPDRTSTDGEPLAAGYYCWLTDYPEEGGIPLDQGDWSPPPDPIPEGCIPADARKLREANHALAVEVQALRLDAERYRYLRAESDKAEPGALDAAVDDARAVIAAASGVPAPTAGDAGGAA